MDGRRHRRLFWGDCMQTDAMDILRQAGMDVEGALGRLMNNQGFYLKMLGKFTQDASFDKLRGFAEAGDSKAGDCAHALKGMCATLGMNRLSDHCAKLQFIYQGRDGDDPGPVLADAIAEYERVMTAIRQVLA